MRALALLIIAACFASPAAAQKVYKCTASGGTVYSQTPCGQTNQAVIEVDSKPPPWPWGEGRSGSKPKPTYTCKDAQGNWTEAACKPPEPPKPPPVQRPVNTEHIAGMQRKAKWRETICGGISSSYAYDCADRQEQNYREMERIRSTATGSNKSTAERCYLEWYKPTAGIVDAVMWRHCYYN